jgi:hypothetical protein
VARRTREDIIVLSTTKGHNMETAHITDQTCACGFSYQDWMDYDVICEAPENGDLHLWEQTN